jgi:hypothetical protein
MKSKWKNAILFAVVVGLALPVPALANYFCTGSIDSANSVILSIAKRTQDIQP